MVNSNQYQLNIRNDAIKFLLNQNLPSIQSALEVGGGGGFTLHSIQSLYSIPTCVNVDLSLPISRAPNIKHICSDFLDSNILASHHTYDLIFALDVLEHIPDITAALAKLFSLGSSGSLYLFSLPNIQHYSLLKNVYFSNTFPRHDSGIFDRTHIHWFTLHDFSNLIKSQGFTICSATYTDHRCFTTCRRYLNPFAKFISPQFLVLASKE